MKKYLIGFGVMVAGICYSQQQSLDTSSGAGMTFILKNQDGTVSDEEKIEGSPYITEYLNANVDNGTQLFKMRYNGFTDLMEFEKNGQLYDLDTEVHKVVNFEGLNKKYVFASYSLNGKAQSGFLLELYNGSKFKLYRKEKIDFKQKKQSTTSFQEETISKYTRAKDRYFIQLVDGSFIESPKSKNKIVELVSDKNAVNEYIKKNNLDISQENDLVILIKYMNSLK